MPLGSGRIATTLALLVLFPLLGGQTEPALRDSREARRKALKRMGGSDRTEKAVRAGLEWLARHQDEEGDWDPDEFGERCADGKCGGKGFEFWNAGLTGLALLAFQGAGHTHNEGEFKETVRRGIDWLLKIQSTKGKLDGAFGYVEIEKGRPKEEWVYNHALATLAICDAYASTEDPALKEPAQRAVDFSLRSRNEGHGWRYGIASGDNDTSLTSWYVQALWAARDAGLEVPEEAFVGAMAWFDKATSDKGATGYRAPDGSSSYLMAQQGKYDAVPAMTAAALLGRLLSGQDKTDPVVLLGRDLLMKKTPEWPRKSARPINMYYWYYGTHVMFQLGGHRWGKWNKELKKALLRNQIREGEPAGSWDPVGEWCIAGGRVYSTAICVVTLEVYYRLPRN